MHEHRINKLSAKLDSLIELQEDKKKGYHPVLGTAGALLIPGIPYHVASSHFTQEVHGGSYSKPLTEDRPLMAKLKREARKLGVNVHTSRSGLGGGAYAWRHKYPTSTGANILPPIKKGPKGFFKGFQWGLRHGPAMKTHIDTGSKAMSGVAMSRTIRPEYKPGILAHELGHIQQPKWLLKHAQVVGKLGPIAPLLYAATTHDEKRGKAAAAIGTAAAAPLLASELHASWKGSQLLKKAGVKGLRRLTPGIGLGTYGTLAATPFLTYKIKKQLGGYRPPEKKLSVKIDDLIEFKLYQPTEKERKKKLQNDYLFERVRPSNMLSKNIERSAQAGI